MAALLLSCDSDVRLHDNDIDVLSEIKFSSKVIKNNVVGMFSVKFKLYCPQSCNFLIIKVNFSLVKLSCLYCQ